MEVIESFVLLLESFRHCFTDPTFKRTAPFESANGKGSWRPDFLTRANILDSVRHRTPRPIVRESHRVN
jgi:hypothetical protein